MLNMDPKIRVSSMYFIESILVIHNKRDENVNVLPIILLLEIYPKETLGRRKKVMCMKMSWKHFLKKAKMYKCHDV